MLARATPAFHSSSAGRVPVPNRNAVNSSQRKCRGMARKRTNDIKRILKTINRDSSESSTLGNQGRARCPHRAVSVLRAATFGGAMGSSRPTLRHQPTRHGLLPKQAIEDAAKVRINLEADPIGIRIINRNPVGSDPNSRAIRLDLQCVVPEAVAPREIDPLVGTG